MSMMKGICLGISLFLITAVNGVGPGVIDSDSFISNTLHRIKFYTDLLVQLGPPYVWGGFWGLLGGDCSGQTRWIYKMAGLFFPRLTAKGMWYGGWPGRRYTTAQGAREEAVFPGLLFFRYKKPFDHVVITRWRAKDAKGKWHIMMAEASSSKKRYKETLIKEDDYRWRHIAGYLIPDISPGFVGGRKK